MPQTGVTTETAVTPQAAVTSQTPQAPVTSPTLQAGATSQTAVVPPVAVVKHSFATFSWTVTLALIFICFCIMFFYVRRKKSTKEVDERAGDEGED